MEIPVWKARMTPFKVIGNLYFVGTIPASAHLIDTGEGLILLDSGYPETLYLVLQSIHELGFDPYDIKYILHCTPFYRRGAGRGVRRNSGTVLPYGGKGQRKGRTLEHPPLLRQP